MDDREKEITAPIEQLGFRVRIVSIEHLTKLAEAFNSIQAQGLVDKEIYRAYLDKFTLKPPDGFEEARSIIIVAVPRPPTRITFTWEGKPAPLIMPPTYLHYRGIFDQVKQTLLEILARQKHRVAKASLPLKLLAVSSGLAAYGKNNISYIEGLGSFFQLVAYYSDLPWRRDGWHEPRMLERCRTCSACLKRCPTGAIVSDRFLIHAERCLSFHNEKPGDIPFSDWINPDWHNSLIGCMRCQEICPENRIHKGKVTQGAHFSEEETALFLKGANLNDLSPATKEKLEQWDLVNLLGLLPRNLIAMRL